MLARQLLPARPLSLNNGMLVGLNRQNALTGLRIARPGLNVGLRFASKTSEPQQINVKQVGVMNGMSLVFPLCFFFIFMLTDCYRYLHS